MRELIELPAPNFNQADTYPSGGRLVGPAWVGMWELLKRDGHWYERGVLVLAGACASPNLGERALRTLPWNAWKRGILEREMIMCKDGYERVHHRVSPLWIETGELVDALT